MPVSLSPSLSLSVLFYYLFYFCFGLETGSTSNSPVWLLLPQPFYCQDDTHVQFPRPLALSPLPSNIPDMYASQSPCSWHGILLLPSERSSQAENSTHTSLYRLYLSPGFLVHLPSQSSKPQAGVFVKFEVFSELQRLFGTWFLIPSCNPCFPMLPVGSENLVLVVFS